MYQIIHERPQDAAQIEPLLDNCFGPERFQKTAYKMREALLPLPELSLVAVDQGAVLATIRYWPVLIGEKLPALLLGPIAVMPSHQGEGIGVDLIRQSLDLAQKLGHLAVVLVGDFDYYSRFGFSNAAEKGLILPGPVDASRFLVSELVEGALQDACGLVVGRELSTTDTARHAVPDETQEIVELLSTFSPPGKAESAES